MLYTANIMQWNYPTVFNNRVYMADGNRIHYCNVGEPGMWEIGRSFDVNLNDADEITALHAYDGLLAFKNNSWSWIKEIESEGHHAFHNEFSDTEYTPEEYFDFSVEAGYFVRKS